MSKNNSDSTKSFVLKESVVFFESQEEFRKWLEMHFENKKELIVGFYKVNSGKPSMTWSQSVDQALCFGWIDGIRKSINNESYCIRFTPRKPNSIWSAINLKKVEELSKSGLMKPAGLKAFSLRTENRSNIYSFENEPILLDPNYESQFKKNTAAWNFFINQAPSYKKAITFWIMNAKQEKTRQSRLEKVINNSAIQKRIS